MGLEVSRDHFLIDCAMKSAAWARAKGALRELVAIQGSYSSDPRDGPTRWERLDERVEAFIRSIEDDGLQE